MSLARDIGDVVPGTNLDIPALDGSSDDGPRLWAEKSVMNVFRIEVEKRRGDRAALPKSSAVDAVSVPGIFRDQPDLQSVAKGSR
jgi:hypothetical protein